MDKLLFILLGLTLMHQTSIYSYDIPSIEGGTIHLSQYQGKKIFLVNIATGGPQSSQLTALEQLYQQHRDSMVIIGVPSNSFGNEPLSGTQLESNLRVTHGLTFPIASREVVSGDSAHALYKWLADKAQNGIVKSRVRGDFQKYLINSQGNLVGIFDTATSPLHDRVQTAIQQNH